MISKQIVQELAEQLFTVDMWSCSCVTRWEPSTLMRHLPTCFLCYIALRIPWDDPRFGSRKHSHSISLWKSYTKRLLS